MRGKPRSRNSDHGRADDWLAEQGELNWLDDPRRDEAAAAGGREASARPPSGSGPGPRREGGGGRGQWPVGAETIARRRRILALATVGLVIVTAVAVLVATSGGGSSKSGPAAVAPTQPQASTPQPTTPPETTATGATGQAQPSSPSGALKVTLPASGTLSSGDSGPAVVALQKVLAALNLKVGKPDGSFGPTTEAAVNAFQTADGLKPDGIVGAATAQKLNQALASPRARG
jgi:hypothetical protein